jgi:hypothetical protein
LCDIEHYIHPFDPLIIDQYIQTNKQKIPLVQFMHKLHIDYAKNTSFIESPNGVKYNKNHKFDMSTDLVYNYLGKLDLCAYAISQFNAYGYVKIDLDGFI